MRFALAKALVWNPKLLILDEPLAHLDVNSQLSILQDLRYLADSVTHPKAIVLTSQHLYAVENITDNIIFMKAGDIKYNGKLKDFGKEMEDNAFELACHLPQEKLISLLRTINYTEIEIIGHNNYIIYTAKNVTAKKVMSLFVDYDINLKYIRDISQSTRRLFKTKTQI